MSEPKYDNAFKATLNGILDLFKKQTPIGVLKEDERLAGKTCFITGANSGLGFAVAVQMAQRGAKVIMACRGGIPEAGEAVKKLSGSQDVHMMSVDLSDLKSIDRLLLQLKQEQINIDIAVYNAAVVPSGSKKMDSGFDQMFLVNYLSAFKLANAMIDAGIIKKNEAHPSRIIFVSSESHRTKLSIDFEKMGVFEEYTMGKVIALYGYYKLMLSTYATELNRRINKESVQISVFALCPGPVNSNIARAAPKIFTPLLKLIFGIFFKSPEAAAEPVMYLACSQSLEKQSGIYLHLMQQKEMDEKALNAENGRKLWEKSEALLASASA